MKARVGEEIRELPPGTEVSRSYGDVDTIWDTCGCMGLCPECRSQEVVAVRGCGRHYIYGTIHGVADSAYHVQLPDGTEYFADEILR